MELGAVVLGALVGVTGAFVIQVFVSPRVEMRVRAMERWEHDVLRLGELLTHDVAASRREAHRAFGVWKMWSDLADSYTGEDPEVGELDPDRLRRRVDESRREMAAAGSEFNDLVRVRGQWLVDRVKPQFVEGDALGKAWSRWSSHVVLVTMTIGWDDRDDHKQGWEEEDKRRGEFVDVVAELAKSIAPPLGVKGRVRREWARVTRSLVRRSSDG